MTATGLYYFNLKYACYGVVADDVVRVAAPIAEWAIGKRMDWFSGWVKRKGGTVKFVSLNQ